MTPKADASYTHRRQRPVITQQWHGQEPVLWPKKAGYPQFRENETNGGLCLRGSPL